MESGRARLANMFPPDVRKEWLRALNRRLGLLAIYWGAIFAFGLVISLWSEVGPLLIWTFVQAESSYVGWHHFYGMGPWMYLLIVLLAGNMNLVVFWHTLFKWEGRILDLPLIGLFLRPERHQRLQKRIREKQRLGLFISGLIPGVWWVGFLYLRNHPLRWGVETVHAGNITKLTAVAVAYRLAVPLEEAMLVVTVIAVMILFFPWRLVERFLPNNNQ